MLAVMTSPAGEAVTFSGLSRNPKRAIPDVFPWTRHLKSGELDEFARELFAALTDAAELDVDANVNEVVTGWRATARIKADRSQYAEALRDTDGDLGPAEVTG